MKPKKQNSMPTPQPPQKPKFRKAPLIILLVIIATGIAGYLYHAHQVKQEQAYQADKTRFAKVETDMKTAYDAMVASAGVPDVSKEGKSCSRVARKYEQGTLSCSVSYSFGYKTQDYPQSIDLVKKLQAALVSTHVYNLSQGTSNANSIDPNNMRYPRTTISFNDNSGTQCNLNFSYDHPRFHEGFTSIDQDYAAILSFDCSENMQKPIYPLAK